MVGLYLSEVYMRATKKMTKLKNNQIVIDNGSGHMTARKYCNFDVQ